MILFCQAPLAIALLVVGLGVPSDARPAKSLRGSKFSKSSRKCDLKKKQFVCHFPPNSPTNCQTLCIRKGADALANYLASGDIQGVCPADCIRPKPEPAVCACGACLPDDNVIEVPTSIHDWHQGPYTGDFQQTEDNTLILKGSAYKQGNLVYSKQSFHLLGSHTEFQMKKFSSPTGKYWLGILGVASVHLPGDIEDSIWYNVVMDVAPDGTSIEFVVTVEDAQGTLIANTTQNGLTGFQQKALLDGTFHANFNDNPWGESTSLTIRNWKTTAKPSCPFLAKSSTSYTFDQNTKIEPPFWTPEFSSAYWSVEFGMVKGHASRPAPPSNPAPAIGYPMYMNIQDDQGVPASRISFAIKSDGPDTYAYMHFFVGSRYGNDGTDPSTEDRSKEIRYLFTNADSDWMEYKFPLDVFPDDYTGPFVVGWYVDPKPAGQETATMWVDDVTLYWD